MARDNKIVNDAINRPWTPAINSATNKVATEQIKVSSDKHLKQLNQIRYIRYQVQKTLDVLLII